MKRDNFILKKVAINGATVYVEYSDGSTTINLVCEQRAEIPHPDLNKSLQGLTSFVAKSTHLTALNELEGWISEQDKKSIFRPFLAKISGMQKDILDQIDVRQLSISNNDSGDKVVISAMLSVKKSSTKINTPKISLSGDIFGFEVALSESIEDVVEEVWQYLFNGKTSQTKLEFSE